MEIIKNIKEVSDVYFNNDKWDTYDGYCIETDSRKLYFVINNGQCCCENWGYLSSEDDFGSFIGSELKNVYVTDLAETQQDLEITRSSNMTILTLLLEKKICSKEEYVSTFNEIQSKNMENINQIKNKIHEIEEQIKQYEQQMRKKG